MNNKSDKPGPAPGQERLTVRKATLADVPALRELTYKVYESTGMPGYTEGALTGQINNFPQGQFVAAYGDRLVGYCATFRISGNRALKPHDWTEITGGGYASRHDPHGDYLYGMEVCVDPDYRGYRIGQRLYKLKNTSMRSSTSRYAIRYCRSSCVMVSRSSA